jgi:hypothetical protein
MSGSGHKLPAQHRGHPTTRTQGVLCVPKILQMFRRIKQSKSRRKAVSNAFKKVLGAEIIQFPKEQEELQRPEEPRLSQDPPDYETITRWLQLADELLGNEDGGSDDRRSEDHASEWRGSGTHGDTRERKEA